MLRGRAKRAKVLAGLEETPDRPALLAQWNRLCGQLPPKGISTTLLHRAVAYKLQERASGGLTATTRKYLMEVAAASRSEGISPPLPDIPVGTRLIRQWQGMVYEAVVERDHVLVNGEQFVSLSAAARSITGAHWSGPRFFGLRKVKTRAA